MEFVEVDGSEGEGGGQIMRSAVSFAAILGLPVKVVKIRAGREVPGLKRQHVSALQVMSRVFGGETHGDSEGSTEVTFVPGKGGPESLSVDMGTAASISLVLQTVVPAIALSGSRLTLDLVGGTDVPWSPTLDYLSRVVTGSFSSIGINFGVQSSRRGYYPRGGGRAVATVEPSGGVVPLDARARAEVREVEMVSRCGSLPRHVAERQLAAASRVFEEAGVSVKSSEVTEEPSSSPGSSFLASFIGAGTFLGADSIGAKGKPAERVGEEAAQRFLTAVITGARLDSNLADMVLPLLSLAGGPSRVRIPEATEHLKSGMRLAALFTSCRWSAKEEGGGTVVEVVPSEDSKLRRHNV